MPLDGEMANVKRVSETICVEFVVSKLVIVEFLSLRVETIRYPLSGYSTCVSLTIFASGGGIRTVSFISAAAAV